MSFKFVFFDTETTCASNNKRLVQIAYKAQKGRIACNLYKPPIAITKMASEIHGYSDADVKDSPIFPGSADFDRLREYVQRGYIFVAHNASFDRGVLANEGIEIDKQICTLQVAKKVFPKKETDSPENYKLETLMKYLQISVKDRQQHQADSDVEVLYELFKALVKAVQRRFKFDELEDAISYMVAISKPKAKSQPKLSPESYKFKTGKHAGKTLQEVFELDPGLISFLEEKGNDSMKANIRAYKEKFAVPA